MENARTFGFAKKLAAVVAAGAIASGVAVTAEIATTTQTAAAASISGPKLKIGAEGEDVRGLQYLLKVSGYLEGDVDGKFGPHTKAAVEQFQRFKGLEVDGVVGPQTWNELIGKVKYGDTSYAFRGVQAILFHKGYREGAEAPKFNSSTLEDVRDFQRDNGLEQDGVVGQDTWNALLS